MDGFMVGLDDVRELDWIPESEDEHEWVLTPEEILDALLNRPARAVSEGTTLGRVRLQGLRKYAAATWTPQPDDAVSGLTVPADRCQDLDQLVSPR